VKVCAGADQSDEGRLDVAAVAIDGVTNQVACRALQDCAYLFVEGRIGVESGDEGRRAEVMGGQARGALCRPVGAEHVDEYDCCEQGAGC
jgi:hypothetical protein